MTEKDPSELTPEQIAELTPSEAAAAGIDVVPVLQHVIRLPIIPDTNVTWQVLPPPGAGDAPVLLLIDAPAMLVGMRFSIASANRVAMGLANAAAEAKTGLQIAGPDHIEAIRRSNGGRKS